MERKYRFGDILLAIAKSFAYVGVWLGVQIGVMLIYEIFILVANSGLSAEEATSLLMSKSLEIVIISNVLTILLIAIFFKLIKSSLMEEAMLRPSPRGSVLPTMLMGASAQYVTVVALSVLMLILPKSWVEVFEENSEMISQGNKAVVFIATVIVAPIVEELLCRGLILNALRKAMPRWFAIVLSSMIFGIMHGNMVQFIYATIIGILFGWIYTKFNSIIIPIFAHMCFNLMSLVNSLITNEIFILILIVVSFPIFVLMLIYFNVKRFEPVEIFDDENGEE